MTDIALTANPVTPTLDATPAGAFVAMLGRDLRVLLKTLPVFLLRTVMQPVLLMFVFTYVFPRIGQAVGGGGAAAAAFSTLLVSGVVGLSMIFQGIQSVALPLVQEFGFTREIEDRVLAPLPVWAVGAQKIASGALQALVAAIVVFPFGYLIPTTSVHLRFDWPVLLTVTPLACVLCASLGLAVGCSFDSRQVPLIFTIIVLPITFLGAVYYPWSSLTPIGWLKVGVLVNPLVYISEGLRAGLTNVHHMPLVAVYGAMLGYTALLGALGIRGFKKRVLL
ncbi:MAG: ABC transporter permease [Actinobacteria bacterium]|nr:ABC transporter permease [Actinomycetota bacterium]